MCWHPLFLLKVYAVYSSSASFELRVSARNTLPFLFPIFLLSPFSFPGCFLLDVPSYQALDLPERPVWA